jgi:aminomethyltransferase
MSDTGGQRTPLYAEHVAAGARMVGFGGWDMPLQYTSALTEHHAVRRSWGLFDVSHMTVVDAAGAGATDYFRMLLANDIGKLTAPGRGLYSCMLNEAGGVVDDLIVYRLEKDHWRVVVNAATRDQDLAWLQRHAAGHDVRLHHRPGVVMMAVQGPAARSAAAACLPAALGSAALALGSFGCVQHGDIFLARTGYTGEDGFELVLPAAAGVELWRRLVAAGATPCGLGARDTLRLEAALNLYGQDMDESTTPLVAGLTWTVALGTPRQFIGRDALERQMMAGLPARQVGLLLEDRGIMRHGQRVVTSAGDGVITSGGFSPTMERSCALARVPLAASGRCEVEIRGGLRAAIVVQPPFVRRGKVLVDTATATGH